MTTSSKWKMDGFFLIENCLSYNIAKFGRKLITSKQDNLNWTKEIMTSSMKNTFFFYSSDANMMTSQHAIGQNHACIHIPNSFAFRIWNNMGGGGEGLHAS